MVKSSASTQTPGASLNAGGWASAGTATSSASAAMTWRDMTIPLAGRATGLVPVVLACEDHGDKPRGSLANGHKFVMVQENDSEALARSERRVGRGPLAVGVDRPGGHGLFLLLVEEGEALGQLGRRRR